MDEQENLNGKTLRWISLLLLAGSIICCLLARPKPEDLNDAQASYSSAQSTYEGAKEKIYKSSPLSKENAQTDLRQAERAAMTYVDKGIKLALGGCKDQKDFANHQSEMAKLIGDSATVDLYQFNGADEEVANAPKTFKFYLNGKKTTTRMGFSKVDDIKAAKLYVIADYWTNTGKENVSLLTFNYDLENMKVNSCDIQQFDDLNLTGNNF